MWPCSTINTFFYTLYISDICSYYNILWYVLGGAKVLQSISSEEASNAKTGAARDVRAYNNFKGSTVRDGSDIIKIVIFIQRNKYQLDLKEGTLI